MSGDRQVLKLVLPNSINDHIFSMNISETSTNMFVYFASFSVEQRSYRFLALCYLPDFCKKNIITFVFVLNRKTTTHLKIFSDSTVIKIWLMDISQ